VNLRDQDCEGNHNTVEEEGHHVIYDFANKEKAVYNVHFLPEPNFLQKCLQKKKKKTSEHAMKYLHCLFTLQHIYSTKNKSTHLVPHYLHNHFAEQISRTTRPSVLLESKGSQSTWKLTFGLYKVQLSKGYK